MAKKKKPAATAATAEVERRDIGAAERHGVGHIEGTTRDDANDGPDVPAVAPATKRLLDEIGVETAPAAPAPAPKRKRMSGQELKDKMRQDRRDEKAHKLANPERTTRRVKAT